MNKNAAKTIEEIEAEVMALKAERCGLFARFDDRNDPSFLAEEGRILSRIDALLAERDAIAAAK